LSSLVSAREPPTTFLHVNGNSSTLKFGDVTVLTPSQPLTATEYNIGKFTHDDANAVLHRDSNRMLRTASWVAQAATAVRRSIPPGRAPSMSNSLRSFVGYSTQQVKIDSTAYNTATPTLGFQGPVQNGGAVQAKDENQMIGFLSPSFAKGAEGGPQEIVLRNLCISSGPLKGTPSSRPQRLRRARL